MNASKRIGISALEARWLLGKTEAQVRHLLKRDVLMYAAPRWIDPANVIALFDDDNLRLEALEALLTCELVAPRPERRYAAPRPIFPYLLPLWLKGTTLSRTHVVRRPAGVTAHVWGLGSTRSTTRRGTDPRPVFLLRHRRLITEERTDVQEIKVHKLICIPAKIVQNVVRQVVRPFKQES
jgi:hypothetical protein